MKIMLFGLSFVLFSIGDALAFEAIAVDSTIPLEISCGFPRDGSFRVITGADNNSMMAFTLDDGDNGQCRSDGKNKRERVELKSENIELDKAYRLTFKFKMENELSIKDWHSFFQIVRRKPKSTPILKLEAYKSDVLRLRFRNALRQRSKDHPTKYVTLATAAQWQAKWNALTVEFNLSAEKHAYLRVYLNKDLKFATQEANIHGSEPYLKFGLYRNSGPLRKGKKYGKVRLLIDDIRLTEMP